MVVVVVAVGITLRNWHEYGARVEVARELADDLSVRISHGKARVLWYPEDQSPLNTQEIRYCGIGTIQMASRGTADRVGCGETESACLAGSIARITPCRKVEVELIPDGSVQAGSPKDPRCGGGFFGARVCAVRQEATVQRQEDGAGTATIRITVH